MSFRHSALLALALGTVSSAQAVVSWIATPQLPMMSGNGRYVFFRGDRWDPYTGRMSRFGSVSPFNGVVIPTYNGETAFMEGIVGEEGQTQIFEVTKTTATPLSNDGGTNATPFGCSSDGSVVIGEVLGATFYPGYVWTNRNPLSFTDALRVVSGNGKVIFGEFAGMPTRWDETGTHDFWTDEWIGAVTDTNYNGSIAVGHDGTRAFKWTAATGFVDLGHLPIGGNNPRSVATSVSNDGSIITGITYTGGNYGVAFVYTNGTMMTVNEFLGRAGTFTSAKVSKNGQALTGHGSTYKVNGAFHVYIAGNHLSLDLRGDSRETFPGRSIFGSTGFATRSTTGRWVDLQSNAPGVVVPSRVYVGTGNFQGEILPGTPGGRYTITARSGDLWVSRDLKVSEPISSVEFETDRIHGGKSTKVIVTLSNPATERVLISLSSAKPGLDLPPPIVIQKGATQGFAYVGSHGRLNLDSFTVVANGEFHTEKSAKVYVYPSIGWLTVSPTSVKGGQPATGRIGTTLAAPAVGLNFSLRSLSSLVSVPASASISLGNTTTQFGIQTSPVTVTATRSIEASSAGVSKTASITLTP